MIKLLQPLMPTTDDLIPYLRKIDQNKIYVNNGPLVRQLEEKLEEITGASCVALANGTLALELAIKSSSINSKKFLSSISIPALTFVATGLASHRLGFNVDLCDIDSESWQLTPEIVKERGVDTSMVIPVATFGRAVDVRLWEGYDKPVVIDSAGAFLSQRISRDKNITTCFSLHATKFIGCGEGGFVASEDQRAIERIRSLAMFGAGGTNAKMSEYHASVALASLDEKFLSAKFDKTEKVANWYLQALYEYLPNCVHSDLNQNTTLLNVLLPVYADTVIERLKDYYIESKQWYRPYLNELCEFTAFSHETKEYLIQRLPVTNHLRGHLIGLPFHTFLTKDDVFHICKTLRKLIK